MSTLPLSTDTPSASTRSILVVDDEDLVRDTIAAMIERQGYTVFQAESAKQAIAIAKTNRIDAFLLDMEMPRTSGMELCRSLRAMDAYRVSPILFVTAPVNKVTSPTPLRPAAMTSSTNRSMP